MFVSSWNNTCDCHSRDATFVLFYGVISFVGGGARNLMFLFQTCLLYVFVVLRCFVVVITVLQLMNPPGFDGYNLVP